MQRKFNMRMEIDVCDTEAIARDILRVSYEQETQFIEDLNSIPEREKDEEEELSYAKSVRDALTICLKYYGDD
jgi:hypothetical protein